MRHRFLLSFALLPILAGCGPSSEQKAAGVQAFAKVQEVFQHPRCRNCHIPGDAPLQFDAGSVHEMNVRRGPEGKGAAGLPCTTCHGDHNAPDSYGPNAPPGAPHWQLPPPNQKMAWINQPAAAVCAMIKDPAQNGGKDMAALLKHISEDKLVLWGWAPGASRAPVSIPHTEFVAAFKTWMDAEGPCPM
jgi:hypothetical protein